MDLGQVIYRDSHSRIDERIEKIKKKRNDIKAIGICFALFVIFFILTYLKIEPHFICCIGKTLSHYYTSAFIYSFKWTSLGIKPLSSAQIAIIPRLLLLCLTLFSPSPVACTPYTDCRTKKRKEY